MTTINKLRLGLVNTERAKKNPEKNTFLIVGFSFVLIMNNIKNKNKKIVKVSVNNSSQYLMD